MAETLRAQAAESAEECLQRGGALAAARAARDVADKRVATMEVSLREVSLQLEEVIQVLLSTSAPHGIPA
jgi:hypothetical protein